MSYILDALRRADAERERGTVPGLHAHPAAAVAADAPAPRAAAPWAWIAVGLLGGLVLVLAWMLLTHEPPAPPLPPPAAPVAPPPVAAALPEAPPAAKPAAPPAEQTPPARPQPRPAAAAPAAPAAPATPATPADRVLAIAELPDEVRRALPALAIGGSIYSESAANRFLIVNGQLFRENDVLTDGLTLRQIKLKSAVLEFRGYRYEIGY